MRGHPGRFTYRVRRRKAHVAPKKPVEPVEGLFPSWWAAARLLVLPVNIALALVLAGIIGYLIWR